MIEAIENMGLSFVRLAGEYLHGFEPHVAASTIRRRFVAHFGVSPCHCAWLWLLIEDELFAKDCYADHKHLLWTLNLLKTDDTEMALKGRWQADEKTIRKWIYIVLEAVSDLDLVRGTKSCSNALFEHLKANDNDTSLHFGR